MFRALIRFIILIVEKIIAAFALVAAFVSMAETGGLVARLTGTLETLGRTFYGFGVAYANNEQFRDVWMRFTTAFDEGLATAAKNIEGDPSLVLYTFIATIVCYKLAAWVLKTLRKSLLKKRPKHIKKSREADPTMKPPKRRPPSPTYDRLYEPPDLSPSTAAQLDTTKM